MFTQIAFVLPQYFFLLQFGAQRKSEVKSRYILSKSALLQICSSQDLAASLAGIVVRRRLEEGEFAYLLLASGQQIFFQHINFYFGIIGKIEKMIQHEIQ